MKIFNFSINFIVYVSTIGLISTVRWTIPALLVAVAIVLFSSNHANSLYLTMVLQSFIYVVLAEILYINHTERGQILWNRLRATDKNKEDRDE